ncbi:Conserved_hypothetical protein [Hexamita inflata]|uniref:Uncharacterized protein n=1 Tax=Hexamita inflata TaxID=28002 RepID=A0AA86P775_9EUKA|nr:Conserved hypothetical protein [Hexamita inflata]
MCLYTHATKNYRQMAEYFPLLLLMQYITRDDSQSRRIYWYERIVAVGSLGTVCIYWNSGQPFNINTVGIIGTKEQLPESGIIPNPITQNSKFLTQKINRTSNLGTSKQPLTVTQLIFHRVKNSRREMKRFETFNIIFLNLVIFVEVSTLNSTPPTKKVYFNCI